jgi:biotin synthase-related radical SAM superfamily protein
MPKMNLTTYMTNDCKRNSEFLPMEKQSQTNPNEPNFLSAVRVAKPKQTQILLAAVIAKAGKANADIKLLRNLRKSVKIKHKT